MGRVVRIGLFAALVGLAVALSFWKITVARRDNTAGRRARTSAVLRLVAMLGSFPEAELPCDTTTDLVPVVLVEEFADERTGLDEFVSANSILDCWKRPILLVPVGTNGLAEYMLVSRGPDGNNDNGRGDDIVERFISLEIRNQRTRVVCF